MQGFAASTMLLCAGHHGSEQATEAGHEHASHRHMGEHHSSRALQPRASDHTAQVGSAHDESAASPLAAKHAKVVGKCSACAACCTVAFLPTSIVTFIAPAPSRALPVVELSTPVGFFTDGPDRPPRLRLA
ncbi:MAG: hypothetical protein ABI671_08260 [Burkholderiales bacterium]